MRKGIAETLTWLAAVAAAGLAVVPPALACFASFSGGKVDSPYSVIVETLDSTRTTGYIWRVTQGEIPPGLRLSMSSELGWSINGTPAREGRYGFTLTAYGGDAPNAPVMKSCQGEIVVEPSVGCPANLGSGYLGLPYSAILEKSAKIGTVWAVASGALPPGLRAEETWIGTQGTRAWQIRGTPSREGRYRFTVTSSIDDRQVNTCPTEILVYSGPLMWVVEGDDRYYRRRVSSLGFTADSPGNAVLILQTTEDLQIPFTISATAPWIRLNLTTGTTPFAFSVSVSDYSVTGFGAVRIDAPAAGNSPLIIPVSVNGDRAKYTVTPSTLAFWHDIASPAGPTATVRVGSAPDRVNYEANSESSWLKITPASGAAPGDLAVTVLPTGLRAGSYTGVITVKAPYHDSPAVSVPVSLTVGSGAPKPSLSVSPASVALISPGSLSARLSLSSSGAGATFTAAASGGSWLSISPASGVTPATLTASANASGLASGSYSGRITIQSPDASNSPVTVPVTLTVPAPPPAPPPAPVLIEVSPVQLSFSHETGGAAPAAQRVGITASAGSLNWSASADRNWITVTPVSGAATASGSSLSIGVNPAGLAAGSYSGSVSLAAPGASNSPRTVSVALAVTAPPPPPLLSGTLVILQTGLTFTYQINGAPPAAQDIVVATTGGELDFRATAAVTRPAGGRWLSVSPTSGTAPRVIKVAVNHSGLDAGGYEGTITISAAGGSSTTLPVRFEVITPVSQTLSADVDFLSFSYAATVGADTRQVTLTNPSFNQLRFVVDTATDTGSGWLRVSEKLGDVGATNPATLLVTADPGNLDPGTYTGTVRVSSPYTDLALAIPVTMTVSGNRRRLQLSQTGLTFIAVAGAGADDVPQDVGVLNTGQGAMPWTASVRGAPGWLSVSPPAGASVAGGEVPLLRVTASAAGLAPGEYSGEVLVAAADADNSPHPISVTLKVRPPGSDPGPSLYPSGLIFTGVAGAASPAEQTVLVLNRGGRETYAGASGFTLDGRNWLSYSPASLRFAGVSVTRGTITVRINTAGLPPAVYEGRVTVSFPAGVNRVLNVLLVISAGSGGKSALREAGTGCTPTRYVPLFTSIEDQFTVTAGAPSATQMLIVDDCGAPVSAASVGASFTNRDRSLSLTPIKDGRWSATWMPANSRQAAVTVNVTAADPARLLENGVAPASGFIKDRSSAPLIDRSRGLMNAASLLAGRPVAPGSMVVITGEQLAVRSEQFAQLPLPETLGGVSVTLGDRPVGLRSVSQSRIEAVLPYDLPVNTTHQLMVRREGALSLPEEVAVAEAQPAIFTQEDGGRTWGKVFTLTDSGETVLAGSRNPAQAGARVIIVCTGLGAATQTVKVSIGGVAAEVTGAEVQADQPGMYLVTAIVPSGIAAGNEVPVQVSVAGQSSPPVTMALR